MKIKDPLTDHDYDGIQEYDNNLPGWWLWIFYITIAFGIFYWTYYHITQKGPTQQQEYDAAMAEHQKAFQSSGSDMNNDSLLALLKDDTAKSEGKKIYATSCQACHGANGEGVVGPNLTDNFWIHGGKPIDIYTVITNGVNDKGMPTWKGQLSQTQISQVTAYVMSLKGSNPANGKAPQGVEVAP